MSWRRFLPHLVVVVVLGLQFALYAAWHRSDEELHTLAAEGSARERVHALHVLTNRGATPHTDRTWDRDSIRALMNDPEPLVVDFAYTVDICRMVQPIWQNRRLEVRLEKDDTGLSAKGETFTTWLRHFLLFRRKVAGRHMGAMLRLKNDEMRWLLDSIAGEEFDGEPILASIHQRQIQANTARTKRMVGPDRDRKRTNNEERRDGGYDPSVEGQRLPGGNKDGKRPR